MALFYGNILLKYDTFIFKMIIILKIPIENIYKKNQWRIKHLYFNMHTRFLFNSTVVWYNK